MFSCRRLAYGVIYSFFMIQNVYADTVHYFYDEGGNLKYHTQMDLTSDDKGVQTAGQKCLSDIEPVVYPDRSTSDPYDEMTCSPDGYVSPPNAYNSLYTCRLQCENGDTIFDILPTSPQKMICADDETPQFIDGVWVCYNPCLDLLDQTVEDFFAPDETINAYRCYSGDYCFAEADQVDGSTCTVEEGIDGCLVNYRYTGERCFPPEPEDGEDPPPEPEDPPPPEEKDPPPCLADQVKVWDANGNSYCVADTNILDLDGTDGGGTDGGGTDGGGTDGGGTDGGGTDGGGTDGGGTDGGGTDGGGTDGGGTDGGGTDITDQVGNGCTTTLCPDGGGTDTGESGTDGGGIVIGDGDTGTDSEGTGTVTGGGDCKSKPTCTGFIAVDCATLHQQWETRCAVEKLGSGSGNSSTVTGDILNCDEVIKCESKNAVECKQLMLARKSYCDNQKSLNATEDDILSELSSYGITNNYGDDNGDGRLDEFSQDKDFSDLIDLSSIFNSQGDLSHSCPPPEKINITLVDYSFDLEIPNELFCEFAQKMAPYFVWLSRIFAGYLILNAFGFQLRRGGGG